MTSMNQIKDLSDRISREFKPKKIILFGSYASGNQGPDSDVDLLVIMDHKGKPVYKAAEIRVKIIPGFPLDLLVRTPQKIRERLKIGDAFIKDILEKGIVLYESLNR
jgi:predicted nucleotidyltransferase